MRLTHATRLAFLSFAVWLAGGALHATHLQAGAPQPSSEGRVDAVFSKWTTSTPGCAVGVSRDGRVLLEKGYGMADLEHDAPITGRTVFEAGSVSKQFTAAAVLLLARDGKISLDDRSEDAIPELRQLGVPLTVRQMLTHTSGLRDWGTVEAIAGWPRTTRVYTHADVLDIVGRQRALNFAPGTNWSYSNTGYNLAAVIVSRVSGQPFVDFCRRRLFEPLGLANTSWRDDHTRLVKGRAIAYTEAKDGYHIQMPFENVHGNGGLLTTVGDLLRWNEHYDKPSSEDAASVRIQQEPARLASGQVLDYALGLYVRQYKGLLEVGHSGATAGYRAYLARYPERHVSVAVLCNAGNAAADRYAHAVADIYLGMAGTAAAAEASERAAAPQATVERAAAAAPAAADAAAARHPAVSLDGRAGMYRHVVTGQPLSLVHDKGTLRLEGGPALVATAGSRFEFADGGMAIEFGAAGGLLVHLSNGLTEPYERVPAARPAPAELHALEGRYASDEAEVEFQVFVQNELMIRRRPGTTITLRPLYKDAFQAPGLGTILFRRRGDQVAEMSIVADRVWDLRLRRVSATPYAP
jgi:CubicO group peptidase (beta-lactamase class C family)